MKITLRHKLLTDKSSVFDIILSACGQSITLPACSEQDAKKLAESIAEAVESHTNEDVVTDY